MHCTVIKNKNKIDLLKGAKKKAKKVCCINGMIFFGPKNKLTVLPKMEAKFSDN